MNAIHIMAIEMEIRREKFRILKSAWMKEAELLGDVFEPPSYSSPIGV